MPDRARLAQRVGRLPTGPGVYRWRDATGRVLYVGKAANLRTRVRSYLRDGGDGRVLVRLLMRRATDVDVISTHTPEEALLLENTLIKQERPPYNLRLKDDKSYLLVRVDRTHPYPRLRLVRKIKRDGAQYFGPFASAKGVRRTLRFLRTMYPLRTCSDRELDERIRPCLYYQIGRCAAPVWTRSRRATTPTWWMGPWRCFAATTPSSSSDCGPTWKRRPIAWTTNARRSSATACRPWRLPTRNKRP